VVTVLPPATKRPESSGNPTKLAIISCIHGNMEALETVFDDIRSQGIEKMICLGDLVGYGPYPNEVVRFIERHNIMTVLGCWDEGIANENPSCGCSYISEEEGALGALAFQWTKQAVNAKTQKFLKQLPFGVKRDLLCGDTLFVHGSPRNTSEYLMDSTHELILFERAASGDCEILVCGHTHVPFVKEVSGTLKVSTKESAPGISSEGASREISLSPKLIINAGSVGEPRHGGKESTYVVLDSGDRSVSIRAVQYDVNKTVSAMKKKSVPDLLIERMKAAQELTGKSKTVTCSC
jgi:predicted phosphodiesterase